MDHTMWKDMEKCVKERCLFLCTILFQVTWVFWKMCISKHYWGCPSLCCFLFIQAFGNVTLLRQKNLLPDSLMKRPSIVWLFWFPKPILWINNPKYCYVLRCVLLISASSVHLWCVQVWEIHLARQKKEQKRFNVTALARLDREISAFSDILFSTTSQKNGGEQ